MFHAQTHNLCLMLASARNICIPGWTLLRDLLQKAHEGNEAARAQLLAVTMSCAARARAATSGRRPQHVAGHDSAGPRKLHAVLECGSSVIRRNAAIYRPAAHVMRSVIVDFARQRPGAAPRRQRRAPAIDRNSAGKTSCQRAGDQVGDALDELQKVDERLARVVEMRYFAGMTEAEVAAMGVTERTVRRDWRARLLARRVPALSLDRPPAGIFSRSRPILHALPRLGKRHPVWSSRCCGPRYLHLNPRVPRLLLTAMVQPGCHRFYR